MAALDGMILEHLADRLFTAERLQIILEAYIARSAETDANRRGHRDPPPRSDFRIGKGSRDAPAATHGYHGALFCSGVASRTGFEPVLPT